MKSLKLLLILLVISTFHIYAQNKPSKKSSSDSLQNNQTQKLYENKIEINDLGIVKSPTARISEDIEMMSSAIAKLNSGDTVIVKYYFPSNQVCFVNYKQINGYMDVEKISCQILANCRDSIKKDIGLKRLQKIEEWEAQKLLEEIKSDSLKKIEEKKFVNEMIKKYGKKWGKIVGNREIMIGMTKAMVLDSWGEPNDINRTVGSWGVHEQWVYGSGQYLYFENGKLTSWQD